MYPSAPLFVTLLLIIKTAAAIAVHSAQCYISSNNVTEQEKRSPCGIVNSSVRPIPKFSKVTNIDSCEELPELLWCWR